MRYVICLEASHQRGMGHLFRGLTLAEGLRSQGHAVHVVMNPDPRAMARAQESPFPLTLVDSLDGETDWERAVIAALEPDWWINDRLHTTRRHAERVVQRGIRLASIDDHGTGADLARVVFLPMEPEPAETLENRLYGPAYAVLNPLIAHMRSRSDLGSPARLLITLGGSDTYGVTPRVLEALGRVRSGTEVQVVLGPGFAHERELDEALRGSPSEVTLHRQPAELIPLLAGADLIVCGGGVTLFEAAALGRPTLVVANEPHEEAIAQYLARHEACVPLGHHAERFETRLKQETDRLLGDNASRRAMGARARQLVDGQGLERILEYLGEE